jgi:DegV family protein with EDD domain
MQIVTDRGADLSSEQSEGLEFHTLPLKITLEGKTYSGDDDISAEEFYKMLSETENFPTTSQPSAGDFAQLYRDLAKTDPEILSIHISSGLSGTVQSATAGAEMVPEANVTIFDTKTLSCPLGWHVESAARARQAGWSIEQILPMLDKIREHSEAYFTLASLKYLIHGGRISHLKGLVASLLNIKPVIGVDKEYGKYITAAQERTLKKAIAKMAAVATARFAEGEKIRVQLLHGNNLPGVEILRDEIIKHFDVAWLPTVPIAPVLGAHTGPTLVGLSVGPAALFSELP